MVTATGDHGEPYGLTVTSFCSVSLNPPMVLICVDPTANTINAIRSAGGFTVNLLRAEEREMSIRFSAQQAGRYDGVSWSRPDSPHAGPILDEVAAGGIECRIWREIPAGDHSVFIAEVERGWLHDEVEPLVHWNRRYFSLGDEVEEPG